jgi:hypothetical protein
MRFKNKSRLRCTRKRNNRSRCSSRRRMSSYSGGTFDAWFGTTMISADKQKKRLILSFDNNFDDTNTNNIRIYIRVSLTNPKKRDFATDSLPHIYLDVPISECAPSDIVKVKFLHMTWFKSLSEEAKTKIPEFRWLEPFSVRWAEIDATYKRTEFKKMQELFLQADYESLYGDLLKYEDPFGGSFDYKAPSPISSSSFKSPRKSSTSAASASASASSSPSSFAAMEAMLQKMNRANAELERQQKRLQTRRSSGNKKNSK